MGTRVGREVHGEEEEKGSRARREGSWRVMKIFRVLRTARDAFSFFLRHGGSPPKALHQSGLTMGKISVHGVPKFSEG